MIQFSGIITALQANSAFDDVQRSYDSVAEITRFFILAVIIIVIVRVLFIFGKWYTDRRQSAAKLANMEAKMREAAKKKIEGRRDSEDKLDEVE